ncbi:MAG: glycosyltransferase [Pirellulales bacterium]|nr:glycosyltransferase [Pirellulales bacterium]
MSTQHLFITRPRLSVAMIVRDEEPVLEETLAGVRSLADELVVEDTGSRDTTCRIAERFGARIGHTPWADDFSAARNACFRRVRGDWVLWLDAGETLPTGAADALRKFIDREASPKKAYRLLVEIPPLQPDAAGEQIAQLRLLPTAAGLHFEGRIRESAATSARKAGLAIETAPGRIIRPGRQHDPERRQRRARRNLALVEREKTEHPQPVSRLLLVEGEADDLLGEYEKAHAAFTQAVAAAAPGSTEMLEGYYGLLGCCSQLPGPGFERINLCLKALEVFPTDAQLLMSMGGFLQGEGRLDLAVRAYQTAMEHGRIDLETWHLGDLPEMATACYCTALQLQGKAAEAGRVLEDALSRYPRSARLQRSALEVFIRLGREEKALEIAKTLFSGSPDRMLLAQVVRGACLARNRRWTAALASLQSAYLSGCKHPFCLRHLASTLLSQGQAEAALPVLEEWRQVEPQHPELLAYLTAVEEQADPAADRQYRVDPAGPTPAPLPPQGAFPHALDLPQKST